VQPVIVGDRAFLSSVPQPPSYWCVCQRFLTIGNA
jgi:hypothetical protein